MSTQITIYTDGAAKGNPGPGGYGTVLISGPHIKEISAGFRKTTNNRMELLAVIIGLEALKISPCDVTIYSDSKYVVDSITLKWLDGWVKKKFKDKKNKDLWLRYIDISKKHRINLIWVKGHAGNKYNEICDRLAVEASQQINLPADLWYEENSD